MDGYADAVSITGSSTFAQEKDRKASTITAILRARENVVLLIAVHLSWGFDNFLHRETIR
jgi:hypothetical protein